MKRNWLPRSDLKPGDPNLLHEPLVVRNKIILPPLHIKLDLIKQFVKALKTEGHCFKYLILAFPCPSIEKIKAVAFDGLQIRKLIKNGNFIRTLSELEKNV